MPARTVIGKTDAAGGGARRATRGGTGNGRKPTRPTRDGSRDTSASTIGNGSPGNTDGERGLAGESLTSRHSERPSTPSTPQWRRPRDAKAFAAQANRVATMILNGEMDLDTARAYSGVARTMAQVLSAEVYRARFLQQEPNLSLDDE